MFLVGSSTVAWFLEKLFDCSTRRTWLRVGATHGPSAMAAGADGGRGAGKKSGKKGESDRTIDLHSQTSSKRWILLVLRCSVARFSAKSLALSMRRTCFRL